MIKLTERVDILDIKRLSWRNNFIREKRKNLEIQIKQIIEFVEKNNEITRIDLENMLNIKESRARELLKLLKEEGKNFEVVLSKNPKYNELNNRFKNLDNIKFNDELI